MMNTVLTNELGQFAFHLPVEAGAKDTTAIPPNSKYRVSIEAPRVLNLLPYSGLLPSGQETTIILEQGGYFRTFAFEDANGPITDPNLLEEIFIRIERPEGTGLFFGYADWKSGKRLPLGTYSASPGIHHEQEPEFEPVEVTADSPQQIVFKARPPKTKTDILYSGQVVHGITGQPMPGVFIIAAGFYEANFSTITPDQWQQLNHLEVNPPLDDSVLEPVHKIIPFDRIVRTGPNGQFEIDINPTEKFQHILKSGQSPFGDTIFKCEFLMAFYENYLAVRYKLDEYSPSESDQNSRIELPTIMLYPAVKVIFEPYLEEKDCSIHFRWEISRKSQPDWTKEFFAFSNKSVYPFIVKEHLHPNMVHTVPIPAGMNVQFRLQIIQDTRGWWCPIYTKQINATQGQTIDLGRISIEPEMTIYIKVLDSVGNPIEGLSVSHGAADGKTWFGQSQITDPNGVAKFFAPPLYKAAFFVGWHGINTKTPWQKLIYETKGPQDANTVFTMQLSDDVFEHLFKENKSQ
jgi:hypothetical protein